ncbi:MAG: 2,3-bisphosphoglycerate-independent phosphoglycerate mutase [Candidatus Nanohaloarchaea archaeon]
MRSNGVVLVVMDGVGVREEEDRNAVKIADTPNLDRIFSTNPYTELEASGKVVGLPPGYMGNSEVGHLHIGSGRTVPQELLRINRMIGDGSLFEEEALKDAAEHAREEDSTVHVMGIASDGGVHGHIDHFLALMEFFSEEGCDVESHPFLDGRDVPPRSADRYLERVEEEADELGNGEIGSFMGRYYSMDRDNNWGRTEKAYNALVHGQGHEASDWEEGLEERYGEDRNDYFVEPVILDGFEPVQNGDVVVFSNWRKDRARQLTEAFVDRGFERFETEELPDLFFVSMKQYRDDFDNPSVLEEETVETTLGEVLSRKELEQLRLTESQKEPHVTYFFDGQREKKFPGTDTKIFKSADVPSYDEKPEMEAEKITSHAEKVMENGTYDFVLLNYPNGDLVGHTSDLEAAVEAVETMDQMVGRLEGSAEENGYTLIITSDHGNCEDMTEENETSHTLNDVPFCIVNGGGKNLRRGGLVNVAGTVLDLLGLETPGVMEDPLFEE